MNFRIFGRFLICLLTAVIDIGSAASLPPVQGKDKYLFEGHLIYSPVGCHDFNDAKILASAYTNYGYQEVSELVEDHHCIKFKDGTGVKVLVIYMFPGTTTTIDKVNIKGFKQTYWVMATSVIR